MIFTCHSTDSTFTTTQRESVFCAARLDMPQAGCAIRGAWDRDIFANNIFANDNFAGASLQATAQKAVINRFESLLNAYGGNQFDRHYLGSDLNPANQSVSLLVGEPTHKSLEPKTYRSREQWRIAAVSS